MVVLVGWTLLGVILAVAGHYRSKPAMQLPDATMDERRPSPVTV